MKELTQSIHKALRDDSVATVGLRALLAHAATPWGVYRAYLPEQPDFSAKNYVTWYLLAASGITSPSVDALIRQQVFSVTAWSKDPDTVTDIHHRVRSVLENLRAVTLPTANCALHQIKWEGAGPELFDADFRVYYRAETYRAYYREDIATN